MSITVSIPQSNSYGFTLYAEGVFQGKYISGNDVNIVLDDSYCVFLYYTFHQHRRLLVCCNPEFVQDNIYKLPNVSAKMAVLFDLRGRTFSRYKEALDYLNLSTKGEFYKLPVNFFWQLAAVCKNKKNNRLNIKNLAYKFNQNIKFEELPAGK